MKRPKFVWIPNKQTRRARRLRFYINDNDMKMVQSPREEEEDR
jgi:hypothetical protein